MPKSIAHDVEEVSPSACGLLKCIFSLQSNKRHDCHLAISLTFFAYYTYLVTHILKIEKNICLKCLLSRQVVSATSSASLAKVKFFEYQTTDKHRYRGLQAL
jgi:hypothetical protein